MTEETNQAAPAEKLVRATWERPELTRLDAGDAEGAAGGGGDNVVYS